MKNINYDIPNPDLLRPNDTCEFGAYVQKTQWAGKNRLITLTRGTCVLSALYTNECEGDSPKQGDYVIVSGIAHEEKRQESGIEIKLTKVSVISRPKEEYPINIFSSDAGCSIEETLPYRNITLKRPETRHAFLISSKVEEAFEMYMGKNGFTKIHTPKIVSENIKRGTQEFSIDYFGSNAYLSKTPQMYLMSAGAAFDRVYEITSVYRAQKHYSTRHLNEFITLNFELSFCESLTYLTNLLSGAIKEMVCSAGETFNSDIPLYTFSEVCDILNKPKTDVDLNPTEELKLSLYVKEKHNSDFVYVTHFPESKRPVYVKTADDGLTKSFDLIFKGTEVATGGIHINSYDEQAEKLHRMGVTADEFLKLHKFGMPPMAGATIGLERFVMKLIDLDNIKEASLFVRDIHNVNP